MLLVWCVLVCFGVFPRSRYYCAGVVIIEAGDEGFCRPWDIDLAGTYNSSAILFIYLFIYLFM